MVDWSLRPLLYVGAISALLLLRKWRQERLRNPSNLPYPPGPKPLPVIGNVNDMPVSHDWLTFTKWAKQYGELVHVHIWGRHFLILSSLQATGDLFDKRSSIYSDRPRLTMLNELIGWDWAFAFMQYGTWWRRHRKTFHQYFYPAAAANYKAAQTSEGRKTLKKLLDRPEEFADHVRQLAASTIMRVVYGIEVTDSKDRYVVQAEKANATLAEGGVPRMFLVDTIPILKHVPAWVPGAGFQIKARRWNKIVLDFVNFPFDTVKQQIAAGTAKPSIAADLLDKLRDVENQEEEEEIAKNTSAVAYSAGADTTVAAILTFLFSMVLHPAEQQKAQAELDAVIGNDRLPEFSDEAQLPYVTAVLKESLRWLPVAPQAIAHCTNADDEYNGYFIPKGTTVIGNSWAILHDELRYPEPDKFIPERFIKDGKINPAVLDPEVAAFGFGRRVCPGRYMAYNSLFITFASILATFNITQAKDENGNLIEVNREMEGGLISFPHQFKIDIKPRSAKAASLIRQAVDNDNE